MSEISNVYKSQDSAVSATFTYAPYVEPVADNRTLACVAIKWQDNPGASVTAVTNCCNATARNFRRLSNNQMNFRAVTFGIAVPYTHSPENVGHAQTFVKKALVSKGIKNDGHTTYAIVNNNAAKGSHTNGITSSIMNPLITTFYHEVGRSDPIHLGSSGGRLANGKYDYQGDGTSFMSRFSSGDLTAIQLYYTGWLKNTQVAYHTDLSATADYPIQSLLANDNTSLKGVLIPIAPGKTLMFSRPTGKKTGVTNMLHQNCCPGGDGAVNRGSRKIGSFGQQMQYEGLNFEQISTDGEEATIRISPVSVKLK